MLKIAVAALAAVVFAGPAFARCKPGQTASWYGEPQKIRSGAQYQPDGITCAHRTYPDGTKLLVTDLDTGRRVVCTVNDHGPAEWTGCQVDLSRGSAHAIGMIGGRREKGVARASIEVYRSWAQAHRWPG